ncbi:hypothetical protein [Neorhizobium sp. S3-V5DH]|uniref:hypothetical protein n=1 Tax=Neorhizobium sp. S3-V5DH TaxID=2485166 RepID=UPI00104F59B6|nr:hypothetical protein [Neorhizobium sp. S3-V5DH]TCV75924.1 hypothetical protein EDE09_101207 [Neorhizobium sp. S3-V5DH]
MIGLYVQALVVAGWLVIGLYLLYVNTQQAAEAEKNGVGVWGMHWSRINIDDPRCPASLRRQVITNGRRFGILNVAALSLIALAEIINRII